MESIRDYLVRRKIDLALHRPIICEEDRTATFYLYNLSGQLVGYQQHRPDAEKRPQKLGPKEARYFTYRKQPTHGVFGVESLCLSERVVFLTEGVFDASRLTFRGASALAVCCNDPQRDLFNWLGALARPVVVVSDNDKAGQRLSKFGNYTEVCPGIGTDLGDAPEEYVSFLLDKHRALY